GYKITGMDYSEIGCAKMKENFRLLGINGEVIQQDLFDNNPTSKKQFDIVYSLGFVEHFSNTTEVVLKHLEFLKPEGLLIIGFPNFRGINGWILERFDTELLAKHNLEVMKISNWNTVESELNLEPLFKKYAGGFEPGMFKTELKNLSIVIIRRLLRFLKNITDRVSFLHKFNARYWSGYIMLVYRKSA
ncbi:MAG: class I SAM-dependent methyltransferase, partial [candidate division Zixibacteria bacterium]|nr:class I SAM-dependent methyltransferase [candidate division Zixibacteria bacterium]